MTGSTEERLDQERGIGHLDEGNSDRDRIHDGWGEVWKATKSARL